MPTFNELRDRQQALIRKGLEGSIFVKRWETDDVPITSLVGPTGLLALPPGYVDVGHVTKDQGATWSRDIETSDVMSWGSAEPTRRDITSDVTGLQFTMQESKRQVFELHDGIDLSAVTYDADGNVSWAKPDRPAMIYYRVLVIAKDGEGADAIYMAKWMPRASVSEPGEQQWNEENEVQYPVTMNAYLDEAVGSSISTLWGAPPAVLGDMGFTAAGP